MFFRALTSRTAVGGLRAFSTTHSPNAMARMTLIGNLVATPESTTTSNGSLMYRYTIAVNERGANADVSYYNVASFMNPGEENSPRANLMGSLQKGTLCYVEADGKMATLEPREGEERGRKVLNLTQKTLQILSPKATTPSS